jgi:hypothetical protein
MYLSLVILIHVNYHPQDSSQIIVIQCESWSMFILITCKVSMHAKLHHSLIESDQLVD